MCNGTTSPARQARHLDELVSCAEHLSSLQTKLCMARSTRTLPAWWGEREDTAVALAAERLLAEASAAAARLSRELYSHEQD